MTRALKLAVVGCAVAALIVGLLFWAALRGLGLL